MKTFAFLLLESGSGVKGSVDSGISSGFPEISDIPISKTHVNPYCADMRILKVSLKTARACLGQSYMAASSYPASPNGVSEFKQLHMALKVLECAAIREENISRSSRDSPTANDEPAWKLSAEYYSLRVALVSMILLPYNELLVSTLVLRKKFRPGARTGWISQSICFPKYLPHA